MPRYRFHCADGTREPDTEGVELADDHAARAAAMQFAGQVLHDNPDEIWEHGQWRVEVTDDDGILLWTVITLAVDAPRPNEAKPRDV